MPNIRIPARCRRRSRCWVASAVLTVGLLCYVQLILNGRPVFEDFAKEFGVRYKLWPAHGQRHEPATVRQVLVTSEVGNVAASKQQKVVIVLTQFRSGSSFTGNIFSATKRSMYFYEPLLPFGMKCGTMENYKFGLLRSLLGCNFTNLQKEYAVGFDATKFKDVGKCVKHGLCFAGGELVREYSSTCNRMTNGSYDGKFHPNSKTCGFPLKETILHHQCKKAKFIFAKVTRACALDRLQAVYDHLNNMGKDVYVIHLVRDPRSTSFSQYKAFRPKSAKVYSEDICGRIRKSLEIVDPSSGKAPKLVSDGKYLRVRFEDLSMDAVGGARKIFRFIGSDLPPEVAINVQETLQKNISRLEEQRSSNDSKADALLQSMKNPYSTVRDSREVLRKWRKDIPLKLAMGVQHECKDIMDKLGYISFRNERDLRNTTLPFFL